MNYIYKEIRYDKISLKKYADLLNLVFKEKIPKTVEFLDWEYNQNPLGKAYGYDAFFNDEIIAHYSAQPIYSNIEGKITKGLLALHVATHPNHRGKGLFSVINNKAHEKASSDGCEFVVGVANKNSAPRYVKALGFKIIRQLDAKIGILIPKKDNYEKDSYCYYRIWDENLINWRLKDPSYKHKIIEKKEILTVIAPTHIKYINAIIYQIPVNQMKGFQYSGIKHLFPLKIWLGIDKKLKWISSINIPTRLRPSPLNLIYLNLKDSKHILDKDNILFSNLDFDAF